MSGQKLIETEAEARAYTSKWGDETATERMEAFVSALIDENRRQNLISKPSEARVWQRHVADSAQLLAHVPRETLSAPISEPWLDLGTGAGFPGMVVAILRPKLPVFLVESRARRAEFLQKAVEGLDLPKCRIFGERLERIELFPARVISARAFAPLDKLLRLSAPFSTKATKYVLPKGRKAAHELGELKSSIRGMFHVEQSLTNREAGIIVSV